jgi:hypothetical protein
MIALVLLALVLALVLAVVMMSLLAYVVGAVVGRVLHRYVPVRDPRTVGLRNHPHPHPSKPAAQCAATNRRIGMVA